MRIKEKLYVDSGEARFDEEGPVQRFTRLVARVEHFAKCSNCGVRSMATDFPDVLDGWVEAHRCQP